MPFFNGDLKDGLGYPSSMRFNTRMITLVSSILILCLGAYIVISAMKGNSIDGGAWAGMGSFLTGIGVIIGGSYYSQQAQKKTELNYQSKREQDCGQINLSPREKSEKDNRDNNDLII